MESNSSDPADFLQKWFHRLHDLRQDLRSLRGAKDDDTKIKSLIDQTIAHYETYYRARSEVCQSDPVWAFTTPWATSIEQGVVFWIAGWRPNILIHLLYSESSWHFEQQLQDIILGAGSGDLGDLSPNQLNLIDELQRKTIHEEDALEVEVGKIHEEMVSRFHESELKLDDVMKRIQDIIRRADDLRMRTLRAVMRLLRPMQALDLLVVVADFEIGVRKFGQRIEDEYNCRPPGRGMVGTEQEMDDCFDRNK